MSESMIFQTSRLVGYVFSFFRGRVVEAPQLADRHVLEHAEGIITFPKLRVLPVGRQGKNHGFKPKVSPKSPN